MKLFKSWLLDILTRAFSLSLLENSRLTIFVLKVEDFDREQLLAVCSAYQDYFSENKLIELRLTCSDYGSGHKESAKEIYLQPCDFDNVRKEDFWRTLTHKLQLSAESLTFYENPLAIAHYDVVTQLEKDSFTNLVVDDFIFAEWIKAKGHRRIIDAGCGAGAFYYLLKKTLGNFEYVGFDYSRGQVTNAKRRNPKVDFFVGSLGKILSTEYSKYDAVHAWSVFPFVSKSDALFGLGQILSANCETFLTISCTKNKPGFIPEERYVLREEDVTGHRQNVMIDYFPNISDVIYLINQSGKYAYSVEEKEYGRHWQTGVNRHASNLVTTRLTTLFGFIGSKLSSNKKYLRVRIYPKTDEKLMKKLFKSFENDFGEDDFVKLLKG